MCPLFPVKLLVELGLDNINNTLVKLESHYNSKVALLESRIYCYLSYLKRFMNIIVMENVAKDLVVLM